MGFAQAAVLASVSFFLGVLFICMHVDHRLLWGELTEEVINDGFTFYTTFFNAPPAIMALLHGMVAVGLIGLLVRLHKWDDSAMFFDGSCLGSYIIAISVYLAVIIPSLRTVVTPLEDVDTRDDQVEAMRVLSAGNVIVMCCFGLILVLQAGQEYARRLEANAIATFEEETQQKPDVPMTDKKNQ